MGVQHDRMDRGDGGWRMDECRDTLIRHSPEWSHRQYQAAGMPCCHVYLLWESRTLMRTHTIPTSLRKILRFGPTMWHTGRAWIWTKDPLLLGILCVQDPPSRNRRKVPGPSGSQGSRWPEKTVADS